MSIHLYQHNEDAYQAAVRMLDERGMAAVIHPTGSGKSMIAFKLVEQHPNQHFLWLSPSEYIYRTQLENTGIVFSNITYMSYSRLMKNEDCIENLKPDYIILDEFHRCGAAEWGRSVRKLLDAYPHARRLGLSATNIRYLDNQRNMAVEIFDGNIASEMTLGEAIVRGILPEPKYVIARYAYRKELDQLKKRVQNLSNKGLIDENQKLLEQLRRALEQADGLETVFARHMTKKNGKYILFCANKEHMDEMKDLAGEWFGKVDAEPHVYTAFYDNAATSQEFADFKADDSAHLKLLYCIDMLNEGIHVADVDGVMLLRPTVSPIVYMQQIGRALSAGGSHTPVVFDLVNNFDSPYCVDCLRQEMQEAYVMFPECYDKSTHFGDRFRIIDETKDSRKLFLQLQHNLNSAWEVYYSAARQWYEATGHLKVPKSYVTPSGLTLGSWIQVQRKLHAGKNGAGLSPERIKRLEKIGMIWTISDYKWDEALRELQKYHDAHGDLDIKARYVTEEGWALGKWINNLRMKVKKYGIDQALTSEQQAQMEALGMIWDKNQAIWDQYFEAAKAYYAAHGNLNVPVKYQTADGVPLGRWLSGIRRRMQNKDMQAALTEAQKEQLKAIGLQEEMQPDLQWKVKYDLAKAYYEANGHLNIPVSYTVDGVKLGRWISNIRSKRKHPESSGMALDEVRIRQMDLIGMDWKT